ncbi:MAG: hypothetical protein Q7T18_03825, partial [Sedimentisphaerales bacterium]|nr:hypothetical protein [Sedimentisphaerales bacterium]
MTTQTFESQIHSGQQITSAATANKAGKCPAATGLSKLLSQALRQASEVSFKKILKSAKTGSLDPAAQTQLQTEKKTGTGDFDQAFFAAAPLISKQTTEKTSADKYKRKLQTSKAPNPDMPPTVEPQSSMHTMTLGNNDAGRTLVTDGPKAKENGVVARNGNRVLGIKQQAEQIAASRNHLEHAKAATNASAVEAQR